MLIYSSSGLDLLFSHIRLKIIEFDSMRNVKDLLICYSSFVDLSVWFNDYEGRSEMFSCVLLYRRRICGCDVIVCFGEHFHFQLMVVTL